MTNTSHFPTFGNLNLIALTQWQYWWWFWFTLLLCLYFVITIRLLYTRTLSMHPKIVTSFRSHGRWGDMLICTIPVFWCLNILTNSHFLLRHLEWQTENSLFTLRVRGKQWYWVYKFDLDTNTSLENHQVILGAGKKVTLVKSTPEQWNLLRETNSSTYTRRDRLDDPFTKINSSVSRLTNPNLYSYLKTATSAAFKAETLNFKNIVTSSVDRYLSSSAIRYYLKPYVKAYKKLNGAPLRFAEPDCRPTHLQTVTEGLSNAIVGGDADTKLANFLKAYSTYHRKTAMIPVARTYLIKSLGLNLGLVNSASRHMLKPIIGTQPTYLKVTSSWTKPDVIKDILTYAKSGTWARLELQRQNTELIERFLKADGVIDSFYSGMLLRTCIVRSLKGMGRTYPAEWPDAHTASDLYRLVLKKIYQEVYQIAIKESNPVLEDALLKLRVSLYIESLIRKAVRVKPVAVESAPADNPVNSLDSLDAQPGEELAQNLTNMTKLTAAEREAIAAEWMAKEEKDCDVCKFIQPIFKKWLASAEFLKPKKQTPNSRNIRRIVWVPNTPDSNDANAPYLRGRGRFVIKPSESEEMLATGISPATRTNVKRLVQLMRVFGRYSFLRQKLNKETPTPFTLPKLVKEVTLGGTDPYYRIYDLLNMRTVYKGGKAVLLPSNLYLRNVNSPLCLPPIMWDARQFNRFMANPLLYALRPESSRLQRRFIYELLANLNRNTPADGSDSGWVEDLTKKSWAAQYIKTVLVTGPFKTHGSNTVNFNVPTLKTLIKSNLSWFWLNQVTGEDDTLAINKPVVKNRWLKNNLNATGLIKLYKVDRPAILNKNLLKLRLTTAANQLRDLNSNISITFIQKKNEPIVYTSGLQKNKVTNLTFIRDVIDSSVNAVKQRLVKLREDKEHLHTWSKKQSYRRELTQNKRLLWVTKQIVLPTKTPITVITNSYDVIHSWFLPGLGLKMDCVPGRSTHHTIYIDRPGYYYGQCAEVCGRRHHHMPIKVLVTPFTHFLYWWNSKVRIKAVELLKSI